MKKQFLILMFLSLAFVFAGVKSYGQYVTYPESPYCISPTILPCAGSTGELNPLPGELYTYTVSTTSATDDVRWFVINNNDLESATSEPDSIISTTGTIIDKGSDYIDPADGTGPYILRLGSSAFVNYNYSTDPTGELDDNGVSATGTDTDHSIEIAWKSFDGLLENEILLVALVSDASGCTNNIEVYRIIPQFLFTLDLAALNDIGDSIGSPLSDPFPEECVSPIENVGYNATTDVSGEGTLTVDYGENWVFFVVNANNFVDSWMPKFNITHDATAINKIEAEWAYADDNFAANSTQTWHTIDVSSGFTTDPVIAGGMNAGYTAEENTVGSGASSAEGGECIIVRVRLDWGTAAENAVNDVTLGFAVEGVMYDANNDLATADDEFLFTNTALLDLGPDTAGDAACDPVEFDDAMNYIITPRPQIISTTGNPDAVFETKQNNTDNYGNNTAP